MGGFNEALHGGSVNQISKLSFFSEIQLRWRSAQMIVNVFRPHRAVQFIEGCAKKINVVSIVLPTGWNSAGDVIDYSQHSNNRRWIDCLIGRLVIETYVSSSHRYFKFLAGIRKACCCFLELPHHLGVFWRAKVEAVSDSSGDSSRDGNISICLS